MECFADYSVNINSTQSIIFSANKNSVSAISKPPAQKMVCYNVSYVTFSFSS